MSKLLYILKYFIFVTLFFSLSYASQTGKNGAFSSAEIKMSKSGKAPQEIRFSEGQEIQLSSFWEGYAKAFNLSKNNEFKSYKTMSDNIGQTHHRYKQYFKGIEVADMQYILHERNGLVHLANGKIVHGLNLSTSPSLSESNALQMALDQLGAERYMWENHKNEAFRKELKKDKQATYYPKGKLVISSVGKKINAENFRLVYRFEIYAEKPSFGYTVDVDAHSGKILNKIPLYMSEDVAGNGNTLYDGNVPIMVSGADYPLPPAPPFNWQLDDWNAYGGDGLSWRPFNPNYGTNGGYDNGWYDVMDTDPIELTGSGQQLSFFHRHNVEAAAGAEAPYDAWDGMNIRISTDDGENWTVLPNPSPAYDNSSLYSFGAMHGEGPDVPGWTGMLDEWTEITHDLSAYSGQTVQIRFAFASDPGYSTAEGSDDNLFGWQVDDIKITNNEGTLYLNSGDTSTVNISAIAGGEVTEISGNYRLRESGRGNGIFTYNAMQGTAYYLSVDFVDEDSSFTDAEDNAGVNTHWAMEQTYDYFLDVHGLDSYDGMGSRVRLYVHWDENWFNAQSLGDGLLRFGDGDGVFSGPLVSLGTVSHEFGHEVTRTFADLIYQSESGALNESFSDIAEACVTYWTHGEYNWLIGADEGIGGYILRSMIDPNSIGDPDTYEGDGWVDTDPDAPDGGGVHTNSSVQNHWFYLLVEGGSGVSDHGYIYHVDGIGFEDAEQISFRNLSVYLTPSSDYSDAISGSISAATDLFGSESQQVQSVIDAWNAVGNAPSWLFTVQNPSLSAKAFTPGVGNIDIVSEISNPSDIAVEVKAIIESYDKAVSDTIPMYDDGAHNDNAENDKVYGTSWAIPAEEDFYRVSIQVFSADSGYIVTEKDFDSFTTVGPVILGSFNQTTADTIIYPGDSKRFHFTIENHSATDTIFNISSRMSSIDTSCAFVVILSIPTYGDIAPGGSGTTSRSTRINFFDTCPGNVTLPFLFEIYSDDNLFWVDTFYISVDSILTALDDQFKKPVQYGLKQNYPNPFNPETIINYGLKKAGHVELSIFDVTGKLIQTLINENQSAGEYSVVFDGHNLPSGVYFYRIKSEKFEQSRKMILLK